MKKTYIFLILFFNLVVAYSQSLSSEKPVPDSTKLIVEKYQFNKYLSIDTTGIDTAQRHLERFGAYEDDLLPSINLGQIGTPSLPILFKKREQFTNFNFLNPYIEYVLKPNRLSFYKTNNPYSDIKYIGGRKAVEQQNLKFLHTLSFENKNFGLEYELFTAKNLAVDNENSSINKFNIWYFQNIKKYNIYLALYFTKIKRAENGGIINLHDSSYTPLEDQQYFFSNVKSLIGYRGIYLNHWFELPNDLIFRHISNVQQKSRIFLEPSLNKEFGPPLISPKETYDSLGVRSMDNTLYLGMLYKNMTLGFSVTNSLQQIYYFRGYLYRLAGEFFTDNYVSFSVSDFKRSFFSGNLIADYYFLGRRLNDYNIRGQQVIDLSKNIEFNFEEKVESCLPGFFYEHYNGNYEAWEKFLEKQKNLSFSGKIRLKKLHLELGGDYGIYKNHIFFDSTALPVQLDETIFMSTLWLKKTFYFGPFASDINLYWQKSNKNKITNVPEYVAMSSLYADFPMFKKAVNINFGVNVSYMSRFYMYGYRPTIGQFYLKNEKMTGNYPILNVFLTAKIKNAVVIVRLDHANDYLLGKYFSTVQYYNLSSYYLRFGVRWWFRT